MTSFINLTPHTLNVLNADASIRVDVPPSGEVARVATSRAQTGEASASPFFVHTLLRLYPERKPQ